MKKIFPFFIFVTILFSSIRPMLLLAAGAAGIVNDPLHTIENIFNGTTQAGILGTETVQTATQIFQQVKTTALDPFVATLAQQAIDGLKKQTINWINSGFQGGGPGFIVNPDTYLKNIANNQIRIQLDSIQKSNSPFSGSVAGTILKNVRASRGSTGSLLVSDLAQTVQKDVCTGANLQKMTLAQLNNGLQVGSRGEVNQNDINKAVNALRSQLCTESALSSPATQQRLLSCAGSGTGCGGWAGLLGSYQPQNTEYGQTIIAQLDINTKATEATKTAKDQSSQGIIPDTKCINSQTTLDGIVTCLNSAVITPVKVVLDSLQNVSTGQYDKLPYTKDFGTFLQGAITSQLSTMLLKGFQSTLTSTGANSGPNVAYDNLLTDSAVPSGLPTGIIPTILVGSKQITIPTNKREMELIVSKASALCISENPNYTNLSAFCDHLKSNEEALQVAQKFKLSVDSYVLAVNGLTVCTNDIVTINSTYQNNSDIISWRSDVDTRQDKINQSRKELDSTLSLAPSSMARIATYIDLLDEALKKNDSTESNDISKGYISSISNNKLIIPQGQERTLMPQFEGFKVQSSNDMKSGLRKSLDSCYQLKAEVSPPPPPPPGGSGGGSGGDTCVVGCGA